MKKFFCTAAAVLICVGLLSGCEGNVPNVSENAVTAAETSAETAAFSESTAAAETSQTKITEETTAVSETETSAKTTEWEDIPPKYEILDMSDYTGNFYEWGYDYDIVAQDRESFAGSEEVLAAAEEILSDRDDLRFEEGVWEDFDGDGKKEGFLLYSCADEVLDYRINYVIFADGNGGAEWLINSLGVCGSLNPIRYNGFIHMCTAFGVNNITHHAEIYAVENSKVVYKKSMFSPGSSFCGAFILESAPQAPGSWISFWNENERKYFTLDIEDISDEEAEELYNSAAFKNDETLSELYESADQLKNRCGVTGKKYYSVGTKSIWIVTFERKNGAFENAEYEIICPYYDGEIYVTGVDIDKAQENMVRLEK